LNSLEINMLILCYLLRMIFLRNTFLFFLLLFSFVGRAQKSYHFEIVVADSLSNEGIEGVVLSSNSVSLNVITDKTGKTSFDLTTNKEKIDLQLSLIGYRNRKLNVDLSNSFISLNVGLTKVIKMLAPAVIEDKEARRNNMTRLDPKLSLVLPTTGGVESLLKSLPGVSSNNELSSQYNVRGGNFDENLIYVNDIEIYRPFLVRSGQQEGLSFINPDLVGSLQFSAGGFEAKYGDKLSSVLDINYRRPTGREASFTATLLGSTAHFGGRSKDARWSHITGLRYRTNRYVLGSLDTKGDYKPLFVDAQSYINFDLSTTWSFSFLGNIAYNRYQFNPSDRETSFGTIQVAKKIYIDFEGQEKNEYSTFLGAATATNRPTDKLTLKYILSGFRSAEIERNNVEGFYNIYDVNNDLGSDSLGDTTNLTGIGHFINHSRNRLLATVISAEHKGIYENIRWGAKVQHEAINDVLNEWTLQDSAGYALPYSESEINLQNVIKQKIDIQSFRMSGYAQNTWVWEGKKEYSLTAGVRGNYWTLNKQFIASPRVNFTIKPDWERNFLFRFASGVYQQAPFYRELRDLQGTLNTGNKAQSSIQAIAGSDYQFSAWNRPFKFTTEIYYKYLYNLIPYTVDNVRIRYYANQRATGYATGIDLKLNGEIVKGAESWVSVSVMKTAEDIQGDKVKRSYDAKGNEVINGSKDVITTTTTNVGYIPRPTDQRVNFSLFFQDYVPKFPTFKVHINLLFGSGFPYGPNIYKRSADTLRIPPYRRVDMGFSKQLIGEGMKKNRPKMFKSIKSAWISLEVFNLLAIQNTISYLWVKDYANITYPIPNYLTNRQINLKLHIDF
jgi:hypothetical protein